MGAASFGFKPVWVNRAKNPDESIPGENGGGSERAGGLILSRARHRKSGISDFRISKVPQVGNVRLAGVKSGAPHAIKRAHLPVRCTPRD